jgi:hypothetical protein
MAFKPCAETLRAEKGLVDRADFEIGREAAQHTYHARAHIAIERVIARAHDDAGGRKLIAMQAPWRAHGDAEGLGFVAARDSRSRRCRTVPHWPAAQFRPEHALARHINPLPRLLSAAPQPQGPEPTGDRRQGLSVAVRQAVWSAERQGHDRLISESGAIGPSSAAGVHASASTPFLSAGAN